MTMLRGSFILIVLGLLLTACGQKQVPPSASDVSSAVPAMTRSLPMSTPYPTYTPTPTATPQPTATLTPTATPQPTAALTPTATPQPTAALTPTPIPPPNLRHINEKRTMLSLINQERRAAGVPPVVLGDNHAAQTHAESSLANCFSSHWGIDGLKPYMRYSMAGGYQANSENGFGLNYCIRPSDGFKGIPDAGTAIQKAMRELMGSPGHRRNILYRWHKKVNIGLAWDVYNSSVFQHFEGDYVEYTALPELRGSILSFEGRVKNGAQFGQGDFLPVTIGYDPPPRPLTRGQLASTNCYSPADPVAYLRSPPPPGRYYPEDTGSTTGEQCPDPYDVPHDAPAPSSYDEAVSFFEAANQVQQALPPSEFVAPYITASTWQVKDGAFSVVADLSEVIDEYGPGVYRVALWGWLGELPNEKPEVISEYSLFHGIPTPSN